MTNIQTTTNPYLTTEMINYLLGQGFYNTKNVVGATLYKKADKGLFIQGSTIRFRYYDGLTLESEFKDLFVFDGLNNITIEYFKRLLVAFDFTFEKETHLKLFGKKTDVLQALKVIASGKAVCLIIFFCSLLFASCAHNAFYIEKDLLTINDKGKAKLTALEPAKIYVPKTNPDTIYRLIPVTVKNKFQYGYGY